MTSVSQHALLGTAIACILLAGGCSQLGMPREAIDPKPVTSVSDATPPGAEKTLGMDQTALVDLQLPASSLVPKPIEPSDRIPDLDVGSFSASDASLLEALQLLLGRSGLSVTVEPGLDATRISAFGLSGKLSEVLDRLSEGAGVFWRYRNGSLIVSGDRPFTVEIPPVMGDTGAEEVVRGLESMGAQKVRLDRTASLISYRADRRVHDVVSDYLAKIRKSKSLIVFQAWLLEVTLNDQRQLGINWNELAWKSGGVALTLAGGTSVVGGTTFGAVYGGNRFSIDGLVSFLQTQGTLSTVSKPSLTMISGGKAKFEVGSIARYVSKAGSSTTGSTVTGTTETESLKVGLQMKMTGDYSQGTVFFQVGLEISDITRFDQYEAFGQQLKLPQTTNRLLETTDRARPGDVILLGGIVSTRDQVDREGVPSGLGFLFPRLFNNQTQRTELVVVLTPKVIRFVDGASQEAAR